ncbi:amino acid adenylation domain-containing protein [Streptomyces sp. NPDC056405]|uniref:amino acid adenylation domain-containing protein n=1 Tax=Streptomyces sp. NPDC056405 TaxID=3345811 RepID=UPI0035E0BCFF
MSAATRFPPAAAGSEDSGSTAPQVDTVHEMIERQATIRPGAVALRCTDGGGLTYAELHHRAAALAGRLTERGVGPGEYVVVRMRRTPEFVVACLAIMRAGGAYVAVDRNWPPARVQQIVDIAGAHLITDDGNGEEGSEPGGEAESFPLLPAAGRHRLPARPGGRRADPTAPPTVAGTDPCTVFFTSGSTGEPKGSVTPHRALVHRFVGVAYADFGPGRVVLQAAPVCWDAMTIELWSVLMNGGTSLLLADEHVVSPELLRCLVRDEHLDTLWLTAALFNAVVDEDPECFSGIGQLLTGGERLSPRHIGRFRAAQPGVRIVNGYGPVETTVFATTWDIEDGDVERYGQVPLGTPLPRTSVHVLTERGVPARTGEAGEICVGGMGLAHGYLGRPELTGERFVTLASGERVYRTGDIGWWHPDGVLLYGGRQDRQIKIRGQRVEPGEVERCLETLDTVRRAIVTVVHAPGGAPVGLVAHCLASDDSVVEEVQALCAARLPPYLRPRRILLHDAFPLTGSGKVDVRALERRGAPPSSRHAAPEADRGSLGAPLVACLTESADLLGCEVQPDDDLFLLGADSLLSMRLVGRMARRHLLRVPYGAVQALRTPRTIMAQARPVSADRTGTVSSEITDSRLDLWLREQFSPGDPAQLVVVSFEVRPAVDRRALREALDLMTARHPAFRTGYRMRGDAVHAEPLTAPEIPLHVMPPTSGHAKERDECPVHWLEPFDLENDTPARCFVTPLPGSCEVTFVIHHIAYDGWSEPTFLAELGAAYDASARGAEHAAAPPSSDGAVHRPSVTESELERARAYWRRCLGGVQPLILPPGTATADRRLAEIRLGLSAEDVDGLCAASGSDPHLTAVAWYGRGIHRLTGTACFTVGSYFAGRDVVGEAVIGYFVRPVPVRLDLTGDATLEAVAAEAGRRWTEALEHSALPLEALADLAPRPAGFGLPPVFQAALAFQNAPAGELRLNGHQVRRLDVSQPAAPMPLSLQIWPRSHGGWDIQLQCDPTLVDSSVLPILAGHLTDTRTDIP